MEMETRTMPDGHSIEVCAVKEGFRLCGWVSSEHLTTPKYNQLAGILSGQLTTDADGRTGQIEHDEIEGAA